MGRSVFDCVLYRNEIDVLTIRLHELDEVVDRFVIVESNITFSGHSRSIHFNPGDPRLAPFADKIRHVIVTDMPVTDDPWQRETWQRNAVLRGVPDAAPGDLLILSDVDEIPRASIVREMIHDTQNSLFGLQLAFYYFFVNFKNVEGPEAAITWTVAGRRDQIEAISPNDLRYAIRDGRVRARIFSDAGWHFSYLMDEAEIRRKISAFSHQELNKPAFLDTVKIRDLVSRGGDLFSRPGFVWALTGSSELPDWLQRSRRGYLSHLFAPTGWADRISQWSYARKYAVRRTPPALPPVIICPYVFDREADEIRIKFELDKRWNRKMQFFLWKDAKQVGPERAFEICWGRFPDRDIVIVHSDMAPLSGQTAIEWFEQICEYRNQLPEAGMIACNLFYPRHNPEEPRRVQCAGGTFRKETVGHLHGDVTEGSGRENGVTDAMLRRVRPVDWVTFGGC